MPGKQVGLARQCYALMGGFGLSIPLFFVTTGAWLLWIVVPLLAGKADRLRRREGRGPRAWAGAGLNPPGG